MKMEDFERCFYEKNSGTFHKTLKAARAASKFPYVSRCWKQGTYVAEMVPVYCYGDSVCTVRSADKEIENKMRKEGRGTRND